MHVRTLTHSMPKAAKITDTGLKSVAVGCPNLATLDVAMATTSQTDKLAFLFQRCTSLCAMSAENSV